MHTYINGHTDTRKVLFAQLGGNWLDASKYNDKWALIQDFDKILIKAQLVQ